MSDKVTKIRINGVEKEVGGSGSGGVSGAYLAPKTLISPSYTGFNQATINPIALVEQLEKAGVSVDEPVMDSGENNEYLEIGYVSSNGSEDPMIEIDISRGSSGGGDVALLAASDTNDESVFTVTVRVMGAFTEGEVYDKTTLREIINYVFTEMAPDLNFYLDSNSGYLENFINIHYETAQEALRYYISNMTEFCEEVIIEYNPGSGSDSGSAPSDNTAK